jgi:hypothetical protein
MTWTTITSPQISASTILHDGLHHGPKDKSHDGNTLSVTSLPLKPNGQKTW